MASKHLRRALAGALLLSVAVNAWLLLRPAPPAPIPPAPAVPRQPQLPDVESIDFTGTAFDLKDATVDDSALQEIKKDAPLEWKDPAKPSLEIPALAPGSGNP